LLINRDEGISNVEYNELWDRIEKEKSNIINKDYRIEKILKTIQSHKPNKDTILSNIEIIYGEIFGIYEYVYHTVIDITAKVDEKSDTIRKTYRYDSIIHIHCRACQIALEILCLLKNGFADGAFARCRTLWELVIYSNFINTYGESVAQAYWEQAREENPSKNAVWAKEASCFEKNKKAQGGSITFDDIRRNCKMPEDVIESWDNFNIHSSKVVHASPIATFGRLLNKKAIEHNALVVGHSIEGLWFPVKYALLFLFQSTNEFTSMALGEETFKQYYLKSLVHEELLNQVLETTVFLSEWINAANYLIHPFESTFLANDSK